jgi:hypothetical protein
MRAAVVLLVCSTLAACASAGDTSIIKPYVEPSMPTPEAASAGVKQAAAEAKITGPVEMSDLRPTDHGPGSFMLCMRALEPGSGKLRTFAVFFNNNEYKGLRLPVILDGCEKENYRPVS